MFEQMLLPEPPKRNRRYMLLALGGQIALVGVLVAIPLLTVQTMPLPELSSVLIAPPPPPPPPPPPAPAHAHVAPKTLVAHAMVTPKFDATKLYTPRQVPKNIPVLPAELPSEPAVVASAAGVSGGVAGGQVGGVLGGVLGGVIGGVPAVAPPPPPPPAVAAPSAPATVRIGGQVEAAKVVSAPPPVYPTLAKDARVEGAVHMDAVIGADGHIENLKVTSGPALLIDAAVDAVKTWTYRPTILNGQAVKVATEIVVNFKLG